MGISYTYEQLKNWTADSMFVSQMKVNSDGKYEAEFALDYNEKLELIDKASDGKVSKVMDLAERFIEAYPSLPQTAYGTARKDAVKKWLKENDTEKLFEKNEFSPEHQTWLFGEKHTLSTHFFGAHEGSRKTFVNRVFRDWLALLCRQERDFYLKHDPMTEKATAFDKATWNHSILVRLLDKAGMCCRLKKNEFGGQRVKLYAHGASEGYELSEEEIEMLYRKSREIEAFIKRLATDGEVGELADRVKECDTSEGE